MPATPPDAATQSRVAFPSRRVTLIVLSILTLPYVLGLLAAALLSFASLLVFPGESKDPVAWIGFLAYCASPIPFVIGIFGGWLGFFLKRYRLTLILAMLPLVETILFVIAYIALESFLQ
jgi:hypothetical protein